LNETIVAADAARICIGRGDQQGNVLRVPTHGNESQASF
jgi:hypothetical protein